MGLRRQDSAGTKQPVWRPAGVSIAHDVCTSLKTNHTLGQAPMQAIMMVPHVGERHTKLSQDNIDAGLAQQSGLAAHVRT